MDRRATWIQYAIVFVVCGIFATPIAWLVFSSFKSSTELSANPYSLLPSQWTPSNYPEALGSLPYTRYLANSLILCIGSVVGSVLSCALVAYGFARIRWKGRNVLFGVLIATLLLPWHITIIPRFLLLRELGMYNSLAALIVPTFLGDAFFIFLLRQFYMSIPEELSEAGRMDGLSEWGVFWHIIVPLSRPALVTVGLFQFIASWNDFNGPLLFLSDPEKFPLAYGLERFISSYSDQTHLLLAAAVLFTLPIVVLFMCAQRTFIRGITTTGVKG